MNIKIVCVGKIKEKYFREGIAEYAKRLGKFCKFEIVEVPDESAPDSMSSAEEKKVKQVEGQKILSKISEDEYVYTLEINGKELSSEELATDIKNLTTYGHSKITFVIGGSLGLDDAVSKRADKKISFGKFTYPHRLMRLILTEQIYRSFMINNGSTYHK